MFDLDLTAKLQALVRIPVEQRDAEWTPAFFEAAWNASLAVPPKPILRGPDGFSYLRINIPAPGPFESNSLANLARNAVENLSGAAIFLSPDKPMPAYVMSMGLLDSLLRFDSWEGDPQDVHEMRRKLAGGANEIQENGQGLQTVTLAADHQVMIGSPSKEYLSPSAAAGLHRHLTQHWAMKDPRVSLMMDPKIVPTRNIVINRRRADFEDPDLIAGQLRMLLWYMPPSRAIMLLPDGWAEQSMTPLTDYFDGRSPN